MKHGLHYNRLGKQHLIYQIVLKVYSLFEQKTNFSVSLCWNKPDVSEDKLLNRVTTRNKKLPVTDFMVNNLELNNTFNTINHNTHDTHNQSNKMPILNIRIKILSNLPPKYLWLTQQKM
jgi:hypothetical protein